MKTLTKTILIGTLAGSFMLNGCEPKTCTSEKITNNSKNICVTKYDESNIMKEKYLDFSANKKGAYLIEGWRCLHREKDKLDKIISYKVDTLPFNQRINFVNDVYRVEITYSDGKIMERSTLDFPAVASYSQ